MKLVIYCVVYFVLDNKHRFNLNLLVLIEVISMSLNLVLVVIKVIMTKYYYSSRIVQRNIVNLKLQLHLTSL